MQVEHFGGLGLGGQVFIAGLQLIDQLFVESGNPQPHFASGHLVNRQLRAVTRDEVLEQLMRDVQVFLELLPALLGVFAEHSERALVFTGGQHFKVDVVLFKQAIDVGQLRHHANGTENGEGCTDDLLADAGHHVAAAGRHFVDAHGQRHAGLADTRQLRRGQAIAVHHAAAAFQAQHHFILGRGQAQQCGDFMAQAFGGRGLDVTVEIQHEHPRLGLGLLLVFLLFSFAFGLAQGLELVLVEQAGLQALTQALVEIIQLADLQLAGGFTTTFAAQCCKADQYHQNSDHQGDGLRQKARVFGQKIHMSP